MNPLQVNTDIMENGGDNIECKVEIQRLILLHIILFCWDVKKKGVSCIVHTTNPV